MRTPKFCIFSIFFAVLLLLGLHPACFSAEVAMKKIHLLYNPYAGKKQAKKILKQAYQFFENHGIEVTTWKTERPMHAAQLAQEASADGYDAFCVIGGDGTVHETINGLLRREDGKRLPLGIIPGGTGNALALDLGITSVEKSLEIIARGIIKPIDVGHIKFRSPYDRDEERYFVNLVGLGMGVRANISAEKLRWLGMPRYNAAILYHIAKNKSLKAEIHVDGQPLVELPHNEEQLKTYRPLSIIMVQNTVYGGKNLRLAPQAQVDDGRLDVVFAPKLERTKLLSLFQKVKKDGSHVREEGVVAKTFATLDIHTQEPEPITIDGENYGTTPVHIDVQAGQLPVLRS